MLLLLFKIGNERYAIDASQVIEVTPLLAFSRVPHAPKGVAGLVNYRGQPVVAVDLSELLTGRPAEERLSTRMIIIRYTGPHQPARLLGLIAENATEMIRRETGELLTTGMKLRHAPYLGPVLLDSRGSIQLINHHFLIPEGAVALPIDKLNMERAGLVTSSSPKGP